MTLDRFYPIFDNPEWFQRLVPLGIKLVQLRSKDKSEAKTRDEVIMCKQICKAHGAQLIVNDYWQIAIDEGCDYIHLGQEDLDDADMKAIKKAGIKFGISTHDHAELDRALSHRPDYIALGPIYPTILKKMKWEQQGVEKLTQWRKLVGQTPLVGIGGMRIDRAKGVFEAGADIVSVVTDITLNPDPEQQIRNWIAATRTGA